VSITKPVVSSIAQSTPLDSRFDNSANQSQSWPRPSDVCLNLRSPRTLPSWSTTHTSCTSVAQSIPAYNKWPSVIRCPSSIMERTWHRTAPSTPVLALEAQLPTGHLGAASRRGTGPPLELEALGVKGRSRQAADASRSL